jgi:hypothetical protein
MAYSLSEHPSLSDLKNEFREDASHHDEWRKEAKKCFDFVAGDQWSDDDKALLDEQGRPHVTFNRIEPLISAVVGSEINNRQEVRYLPREPGDAKPNEVLTRGAEWFRDETDAEDEETAAFMDAAICGWGWTETRLDFEHDLDGMPLVEHVDAFEVFPDRHARKHNLIDRKRTWRVRKMPLSEARSMFPEVNEADLHAAWAERVFTALEEPTDNDKDRYDGHNAEDARLRDDGLVVVVECQYFLNEKVKRFPDPQTGQLIMANPERFEELKAKRVLPPDTPSVDQMKRKYYRVFCGSAMLSDEPEELPNGEDFTYQAVTCFRHRTKRMWYGIVKAMMDPQEWSNKWLSQAMHILNSNAKGGVFIENDAVEDINDFEDSYAAADQATFVNDGALRDGKIQPKPQTQFPAGFFQLMTFAVDAVRDVSGINLEMLGMREANQPGVLEYQRRQAGMTILGRLFNSLRRYRKIQGRVMLSLITKYMMDGRLIRIVGEQGAQYVPLVAKTDGKFDVIVDEAPSSPNQKERSWQIINQMLPTIASLNPPPELWAELVTFSPLPESLIDKIKEVLAQDPNQDPMAQQMQALELAKTQSEIVENQAQAKANEARAMEDMADAALKQANIATADVSYQYG